ncbi:MAG: leucine-rich repeat protein [Alistipes sp.]|nr:leucine-rich repeat protein [Alistipes sp.]
MKKLLNLLLSAVIILAVSCGESYDDSLIWEKLNDHENRITKLEEICKQMNTNITSLQTIVEALQNNDYVTNIAPITMDGKIVGYTITFSKSGSVTIYHGKDGKDGANGKDGQDGKDGADGYTPVIGVAMDSDGVYYWTLDGDWLLDKDGNKVKAEGTDGKDGEDGTDGKDGEDGKDGQDGTNGKDGQNGKDGITPKLKIENGYWLISYDNGSTWQELGKATGEDGKDGADGEDGTGGDSMFKDVTYDDDYVYITLTDGSTLIIPFHMILKSNEIHYTSSDGKIVTPYNTNAFGANIISNEYKDGKGIITFDGAVTEIGFMAFAYCSSLTSITIGNSVTRVVESAFFGCQSLESFHGKFASSDNRCLIIDGILISFAPAGLTTYTIPDSVTRIGDRAFYGCDSLESITIPNSVTMIGGYAFFGCYSLTSVYCKPTTPPAVSREMFRNPKIYVHRKAVDAYKSAFGWRDYADAIEGYDF